MATTTPLSLLLQRGGDLMGKGGHAHLSTLIHSSLSSRKGLMGDYDNAHLHAPTCLPSLYKTKNQVMARRRWMDMLTTTPLASRGGDLMGKGAHAHLSIPFHPRYSSRTGLIGDYGNAHPHLPTLILFLSKRKDRAMATEGGWAWSPPLHYLL